jgi:molybdate transport system ATP-binding protein
MQLDVEIRKTLVARGRRVEIDVRFAAGAERLVLFGASGAGKTMTLQAIAGLVTPDDGRIAHAGDVWFDRAGRVDVPPRRRRVGLMFQDYALFPHLTVAQNVGAVHATRWSRLPAGAPRREVERLLERFQLAAMRDAYPAQLSGGQRQRTALARALAGTPRLLLLDEPFASLDETLRQAARDELLALQKQTGVPMVIITHDPRDIDALAQQVVHIDTGRVVDTPRVARDAGHDGSAADVARL